MPAENICLASLKPHSTLLFGEYGAALGQQLAGAKGAEMKVLIVEDNRPVAEATRLILTKNGWNTEHVDTAEAAHVKLASDEFDLVLLDLLLPDADGFAILRQIRSSGSAIPVIVRTGLLESEDVCKALSLGADDFLRKPVDATELNLRIDAVMRRCERSSQTRLRVGELELQLDEHSASISGAPLKLTRREFQVLALLAKRKGGTVSKESFYASIYDSLPGAKGSVDVIQLFVHKLRKKFEAVGSSGIRIVSSRGEGYSLQCS